MISPSPSSSQNLLLSQLPTISIAAAAIALGTYTLWKRRTSKCCLVEDLQSLLLKTTSKEDTEDDCIYLDYNGTTPVNPIVLAAMLPFLTIHFGNPSSSHFYGHEPKLALNQARTSLLELIGCPEEPTSSIWFTGCGTESDNLVIQLALQSNPTQQKKHIVTTNVEHPAIAECLKHLEETIPELEVTYVPVEKDGRVLAENVINAIRDDDETILVTVMLANNESGALQPVSEIAAECRKRTILFHTDAAQACGKVDVAELTKGVDMMTIVGHKLGAPKGVAALYVRDECKIRDFDRGIMLLGGGQEGGRRGGTENVPYCVGLGKASRLAVAHLEQNTLRMETMRTRLYRRLREKIPTSVELRVNGPTSPHDRLPNTLSIGIAGIQSSILLNAISNKVAASAGAACHSSGSSSVSSVLKAMQVPKEFAEGTLRLSLGPSTNAEDIDRAATIIAQQVILQHQQSSSLVSK